MTRLAPTTLVYFARLRSDDGGFLAYVPETMPITLKEAAERLKHTQDAWILPTDGGSRVLRGW